MSYHISCNESVITIRLFDRDDWQDIYRAIILTLSRQLGPVTVILDLASINSLDENLKNALFKAFQDRKIIRLGICGVRPELNKVVTELQKSLFTRYAVVVTELENDLQVALGLAAPQPVKRQGMLAYLKR